MSEEIGDLTLGGNIVLSGFSVVDSGSMVIVKKIVGTYAKKLSEAHTDFEQLKIHVKPVHKAGEGPAKKFEIHAHVSIGGKVHVAEVTDNNLFMVLDKAIKKVDAMLGD